MVLENDDVALRRSFSAPDSCSINSIIRALYSRAWLTASASSSPSWQHSRSSASSATLSRSHTLISSSFILSSLSKLFFSSLSNSSFLRRSAASSPPFLCCGAATAAEAIPMLGAILLPKNIYISS
ncbi:hypothetical protein MIMGU_mgv1a016332mg [Erythranthe guttata]|uniref:Uncharacterized protein n=1 Tax=Erythranthe guttata TaxID=4155 RepID=A0A022RZ63_ERYGU|nr:hypothetical protein MIMGU_mgv1a016332mg [Erythranthe guttata]